MEDEPCAGVEAEGDAFAESPNLGDFLPGQRIEAGIEGANEKRAANADLVKGLLLDTGAEGFDVDRDVREFRQVCILPAFGPERLGSYDYSPSGRIAWSFASDSFIQMDDFKLLVVGFRMGSRDEWRSDLRLLSSLQCRSVTMTWFRIAIVLLLGIGIPGTSGSFGWSLAAQEKAASEPVTFTTKEDHQNMLGQLGITKLRPGRDGNNKSAPNAANYDEARANPFPQLPELLVCNDGSVVKSKEDWIAKRRPEIVELFEKEVVGRIPQDVPQVTWNVIEEKEITHGDIPVIERKLEGVVDNARCPSISVKISLRVGYPKKAEKPVSALMMFAFSFGPPRGGQGGPGFRPPGPTREETLVKAGWGYAFLNPTSVQADDGKGLTRGIIGLVNLGQPRKPEDWGSLRAWGWGASRALDYLETVPAIDAKRVGIEGVSRYGKAALVTMAFDERFAAGLIASSGEGGAKLHRRHFGEAVENLTGSGEYHWMAGNFIKYGAEESSFGSKNAGDIPVDAHQLIALCAPRLTFISYGVPEKGDALWLDQQGSYMATVAAQPAFRLYGAKALGVSDDYNVEKMPAVNVDLLEGELAWRQHDGGHTSGPNLPHFLAWANRKFGEVASQSAK